MSRLTRFQWVIIALAGAAFILSACASAVGGSASSDATLSYLVEGQPAAWPATNSAKPLIAADANPSPDGTRWLDGSFYTLTLHDTVTGDEIVAASGEAGHEIIPESVSWSPDGRRFAYLQFETSVYRVQVISLDGLIQHTVDVPVSRAGSRIAWLDGQRLIYSDLDRLLVYDLESGAVLDIGEGRMPRPSPDGTKVAFERVSDVGRDGCATAVVVGVVDADGSQWRTALDEEGRFASIVGWSEGGAALLVLSRPIDCNADLTPQWDRLLRIDVQAGAVSTLSTQRDGPWPLDLLASDPNSERVAFVRPGCDPLTATETSQELVISSTGNPQVIDVIVQARSPGCAFALLRWLPSGVQRPDMS